MVMPKDHDKTVIFGLDDMKQAVRRMSFLADERNHSIRIVIREGDLAARAKLFLK